MSFIWKCAFFAWLTTITVLSLIPHPPVPEQGFLAWDKFQHASAYGVLTFLGAMAFSFNRCSSGRRFLAAALLAVVVGGLMELAQGGFTATRNADWGDLLADAVGAAAVVGLARLVATLGSHGRGPFRSVEKGET
jgi:VanZ family protein